MPESLKSMLHSRYMKTDEIGDKSIIYLKTKYIEFRFVCEPLLSQMIYSMMQIQNR